MKSFPYSLILDPHPRFGLTSSEFLNLYYFLLIGQFLSNCSVLVCLSCKVHVKSLRFYSFKTDGKTGSDLWLGFVLTSSAPYKTEAEIY